MQHSGRRWALVGAVAVLTGFVTVGTALAVGPGLAAPGYVSEAGTVVSPLAAAYRAGLLALGAGVVGVGLAFAPVSRAVTGLLAVSGVGAALSGAVSCSAGCPLPPYETPTPADLVHGAAAIVGMAACLLAMVLSAARPVSAADRWAATVAAAAAVPLAGATALTMLVAGRGAVAGALERLLVCVAVGWLVVVAALRWRAGGRSGRVPVRPPDRPAVRGPA
jgi:hypothetical protein